MKKLTALLCLALILALNGYTQSIKNSKILQTQNTKHKTLTLAKRQINNQPKSNMELLEQLLYKPEVLNLKTNKSTKNSLKKQTETYLIPTTNQIYTWNSSANDSNGDWELNYNTTYNYSVDENSNTQTRILTNPISGKNVYKYVSTASINGKSAQEFLWNNTTEAWKIVTDIYTKYDEEGRLIEDNFYSNIDGEVSSKFIYTYNELNQISNVIEQIWDSNTSDWTDYKITTTKQTSTNDIDEQIIRRLNLETGNIENYSRYSYTEKEDTIFIKNQYWDKEAIGGPGEWIDFDITKLTINESGQVIENLNKIIDGDNYSATKTTYIYDEIVIDKRIQEKNEIWIGTIDDGIWINNERYIDIDQNPENNTYNTYTYQRWYSEANDGLGDWINEEKIYENNTFPTINSGHQIWDETANNGSGDWDDIAKYQDIYNDKNQIITEIIELWSFSGEEVQYTATSKNSKYINETLFEITELSKVNETDKWKNNLKFANMSFNEVSNELEKYYILKWDEQANDGLGDWAEYKIFSNFEDTQAGKYYEIFDTYDTEKMEYNVKETFIYESNEDEPTYYKQEFIDNNWIVTKTNLVNLPIPIYNENNILIEEIIQTYDLENDKMINLTKTVFGDFIDANTLVSVENIKETVSIKVYPNPTSDQLFIENINLDNISLKIFDIRGLLILKQEQIISNKAIDIKRLKSGIYFINLSNGQNNYQFKIIKN